MWKLSWLILSLLSSLVLASENANVVARADPTETNTIPLPSPTPQLVFNKLIVSKTCESGSVTWLYSGPEDLTANMDLIITNVDVNQVGDTSSGSGVFHTFTDGANQGPDPDRRRGVFGRGTPNHLEHPVILTIQPDLSPIGQLFFWNKIIVPQGNYMFLANFTKFDQQYRSPDFFIANGTDVSCLETSPPPSSSTSSDGGTLPTSASESSSESSSTSPPTQAPVSGASKINKPALAGGIVGGLAVLALLLAAFLCFWSSPRRERWGAVGSFDGAPAGRSRATKGPYGSKSKTTGLSVALGLAPDKQKNPKHKSHSESMGPIMAMESSIAGPTNSDEYVNDQEKYSGSRSEISHGHEIEMAVPVLGITAPAAAQKNPVRNSSQSYTYAYPTPSPSLQPRTRSQSTKNGSHSPQTFPESVHNSTTTLDSFPGIPNPRRASSPPIGGLSPAYPSGSSAVLPPNSAEFGASSSSATPSPITPTAARKTPRKPVPKYSPGTAAEEPSAAIPLEGLGLHPNGSDDLPGGKPMHYLIPDPLPPQRG